MTSRHSTCLVAALVSAITFPTGIPKAQAQSRFDELANLPFVENRTTDATAQPLGDELLFQRATQTYLWALPLLNTLGMQDGSEKVFGAGYNVLPIWKGRLDARTVVTTPNSDVLYAMSYLDLNMDEPIVLDAPPGLQGILLDFWQRLIPVDGGKFLILPPGFKGENPEGYHVYRSGTYNVLVFLRGVYEDPKNLKPAVEHLEKTRIYPLNPIHSASLRPSASSRGSRSCRTCISERFSIVPPRLPTR